MTKKQGGTAIVDSVFPERLKEILIQKKMTQQELADVLGVCVFRRT